MRRSAFIFVTCLVDQFFPEVGFSVANVLKRFDVDVKVNTSQTCCGQPFFNSGHWKEARRLAGKFIDEYRGVEAVIVPSGSCTSMIRNHFQELFNSSGDHQPDLSSVKVYEFTEYLSEELNIESLENFQSRIPDYHKLTYHDACHSKRELGLDELPRKLIKSLNKFELVEMEQAEVCCGFGGTFSVKFPDISTAMVEDKVSNVINSGADAVVSNDMSCLMNIKGALQRRKSSVKCLHISKVIEDSLCKGNLY